MKPKLVVKLILALAICLMFPPAAAMAQSAIAGVVKDTSGAVLPGVDVQASSPVLIEKVRSAVTDSLGQYKITDLRPGVYTITFTLAGFNTVKREGLELPSNFTAPVNAEMKVGAVEETVTVAGAAPVVDVQSVVTQTVLSQKILDAIPTGRSMWATGLVVPGFTAKKGSAGRDVGGTSGVDQQSMFVHGSDSKDATILVDGMRINSTEADGGVNTYVNPGQFAEMSYATSAIEAEHSGGGVRLNMIPKDGGNMVKGDVFYSFTNHTLQSPSLTPELFAAGLKAADHVDRMDDFNASVGGPLIRNRLWYYTSYRRWVVDTPIANSFATDTSVPNVNTWTPDLTKQVIDDNSVNSGTVRLTLQVNSKNKVSAYYERPSKFRGHEQTTGGGISGSLWARETFGHRGGGPPDQTAGVYYMASTKWTGVWTDKLLFEGGYMVTNQSPPTGELLPDLLGTNPIPKVDINNGVSWGAPTDTFTNRVTLRKTAIANLTYVTGSHAIKGGLEASRGFMVKQYSFEAPGVNFIERFASGVPNSVVIYNTPVDEREDLNLDLGIFLQDTWTFKRVTVSPGIRYEHLDSGYPSQGVPVSAQQLLISEGYAVRPTFPGRENLPIWNTWSPRFGIAYDVFGDGRTAVKASLSRYQSAQSISIAGMYNPMRIQTETRTWNDVNKDLIYEPGIDTLSATSNVNFGGIFRDMDPNLKRPYNTEVTALISRAISQGMGVSFGYYRRTFGNIIYSDNPVLDVPGAFTLLNITNPCLTNASWNCPGTILPTVPVYSINANLQGLGTVTDTNSSQNTRVYNGFEGTFRARINKANFLVSFTTDRTVTQTCQALASAFADASNPNKGLLCDQTQFHIPFQTQFKLNGTYDLPYGFHVSGNYQSNPGAISQVTFTATRQNTPGLVQSSVAVPLVEPGSFILPQHNQVDFRIARTFPFWKSKVDLQMDLFNALNARTIDAQTLTAGSALNTPTRVLQPRIVAFGAQLHF